MLTEVCSMAHYLQEIQQVMNKVHVGTCGTHQTGLKLQLQVKRMEYYWPKMIALLNSPKMPLSVLRQVYMPASKTLTSNNTFLALHDMGDGY